MMTKGQEFLKTLSDYKVKYDWDGLMRDMYHDNTQLVSYEFILKGKEDIKTHFMEVPGRIGTVVGMSLDYFGESDDVIIYKGTIKTEKAGTVKANEALYLRDGKIYREIALTIPPEDTKEWALKGLSPLEFGKDHGMTPGEKFYQEHGGYIARGDIDGLMRDHYHEDAKMVSFEFVLEGREAIGNYLKESPRLTGQILGVSTERFAESDNVLMFKASVKTEKFGTIKADDIFCLEDGKIRRHIALTIPPDKTKEWAMKEI